MKSRTKYFTLSQTLLLIQNGRRCRDDDQDQHATCWWGWYLTPNVTIPRFGGRFTKGWSKRDLSSCDRTLHRLGQILCLHVQQLRTAHLQCKIILAPSTTNTLWNGIFFHTELILVENVQKKYVKYFKYRDCKWNYGPAWWTYSTEYFFHFLNSC